MTTVPMTETNYTWSRPDFLLQLRLTKQHKKIVHQKCRLYFVCMHMHECIFNYGNKNSLKQNMLKQNSVWVFWLLPVEPIYAIAWLQFWHFRLSFLQRTWYVFIDEQASGIIKTTTKKPTPFSIETKLNWRNSLCNPQLNRLFTPYWANKKIPTRFQSTNPNQ